MASKRTGQTHQARVEVLKLSWAFGLLLIGSEVASAGSESFSLPLRLLPAICEHIEPHALAQTEGLDLEATAEIDFGGQSRGWQATFVVGGADTLFVQRLAPGDNFRGARLEWWRNKKPKLFLGVGADCRVQTARRMSYDKQGRAISVIHLDPHLNDTAVHDLLNPPVPRAKRIDGVRVALLDAGVNYMLSDINQHLARDEKGNVLGYDFWDLDQRPFDANPARSAFFPQRHGTRTASLLIREAPNAVLVPYRYPRPDMSRMRDVLDEVKRRNIMIVGMPLGSKRMWEWETFVQSAKASTDLLFIVSAGNEGINIDDVPIYPASYDLDNMIVVTSADDTGRPARGSNWGKQSVDLLVPAENQTAIDFDGKQVSVSGSSYAVSRVAAMAVRLLEQHPEWPASEIKRAIFERAVPTRFNKFVAVGYLPDPLAQPTDVSLIRKRHIEKVATVDSKTLKLDLSIVVLEESGWRDSQIPGLIDRIDHILSQCNIRVTRVREYVLRVSPRLLDFDAATSHTLVNQTNIPKPILFMMRDTLRDPAYEGEAFGKANSRYREWLQNTIWVIASITDPDVGIAHELLHVLSDSGEHVSEQGNLMQANTRRGEIYLKPTQCQRARQTALANGLLAR